MNWGLLGGVILASVASAVTAGIVVLVGQEGGGEPEIGPFKGHQIS